MKKLVAIVFLAAVSTFAQSAAPGSVTVPNPATNQPAFQLSASVLSLSGIGPTVAATDIGAAFSVTKNFALRSDNILAPANNFQGYFGGGQYVLGFLNKPLSKTNLNASHFQFYVMGGVGTSRIVNASGPVSQNVSGLFGGGGNYDPTGAGKFTINLFEVKACFKCTGLVSPAAKGTPGNVTSVLASVGLKLGF